MKGIEPQRLVNALVFCIENVMTTKFFFSRPDYPHMESDVLDLATGLGPAFINGANEFNGLAGEDVDSGGKL